MDYFPKLKEHFNDYRMWLELRKEQGHKMDSDAKAMANALARAAARLQRMKVPPALAAKEPDGLKAIKALRPNGPRKMALKLSDAQLLDKLSGAWYGRAAGCVLGIPCEGFSRSDIKNACNALGMPYPLRSYWKLDPKPAVGLNRPQYSCTPRRAFLLDNLKFIGSDDDLAYTLIGLVILEEYGPDFTPQDAGEAWLKYLSQCCTAEKVAMRNLRDGMKPPKTAHKNNPFTDWIGADIRSDPWAYAAPGWPEKAAEFAWRDSTISHRATGIHGEMFFSAVISAAFVVDDPIKALKIALTEIPKACRTADAVKAALARCKKEKTWDAAIEGILKKYDGMHMAHTLNNLEVTIAGLWYGKRDFEKTITLTVMGGIDTDCTGATAGSILGAILGKKRLPKKWIAPLGNRVETYLRGMRWWKSNDIARRFLKIARKIRGSAG